MKRILIILVSTLLLTGCGFHPRRANDVPPELHTLYLKSSKPYSPLITQLRSMLASLNIKLVNKQSDAPYTLNVSNIVFSQSNPPITTTTLAVSFSYTMSVSVHIQARDGKQLIPTKSLSAQRSISQNASQVYTPGTATLAKQELRRDIISQIYYVLISNNLRNALHVHKPT